MVVIEAYDGSFVITGMTYAELEDLVTAHDSSPISSFIFDFELYGDQDPIQPMRDALVRYRSHSELTAASQETPRET